MKIAFLLFDRTDGGHARTQGGPARRGSKEVSRLGLALWRESPAVTSVRRSRVACPVARSVVLWDGGAVTVCIFGCGVPVPVHGGSAGEDGGHAGLDAVADIGLGLGGSVGGGACICLLFQLGARGGNEGPQAGVVRGVFVEFRGFDLVELG